MFVMPMFNDCMTMRFQFSWMAELMWMRCSRVSFKRFWLFCCQTIYKTHAIIFPFWVCRTPPSNKKPPTYHLDRLIEMEMMKVRHIFAICVCFMPKVFNAVRDNFNKTWQFNDSRDFTRTTMLLCFITLYCRYALTS